MRKGSLRVVVALAVPALLIGAAVPAQAAGAGAGASGAPSVSVQASMTRAAARAAYLDAVCPLTGALASLDRALQGDSWRQARIALRVVSHQYLRTAYQLDHPSRPWPADVRAPIAKVSVMDSLSAAVNDTMSVAGSLPAYRALMDAFTSDFPHLAIAAPMVAGGRAVPVVKARLGIATSARCPASLTSTTRALPSADVAPTGDVVPGAMPTAMARAYYLACVCPLNAALMALPAAEQGTSWRTLRIALRVTASQGLAASVKLARPARPWPVAVRTPVTAVSRYDLINAAVSDTLSLAGSMAVYRAMSATFSHDAMSLAVLAPIVAGYRAVPQVRAGLGLPAEGGCPGD